jgi:ubiquinone/menaquinone biosynthesis C-methylase UbiE
LAEIGRCDEYAKGDPYTVEERLDSEFHQRRIHLTVELVRTVIQPEAKVLDLGCGEGLITTRLAKVAGEEQVYGLDHSLTAIAKAKTKFPLLEFCVADAYKLPYPKHYFDIVVCNNLWEHLPDPLHLLRVVTCVLKPMGHLIVSTPSRFRLDNMINIIRGRPLCFMNSNHVTEYTVGQVTEQLRYGGFEISNIASRPLNAESGIKPFLRTKLIKGLLTVGLKALSISPVCLESTVFYLARMDNQS